VGYRPERRSLHVVSNPPNPWHQTNVDWLGEPPATELQILEDRSHSILSKNDSPDISFTYSVNPYRGCYHGCAYCYARPTHQYLDLGAGTDFERKLVVKPDAPRLLREAFDRKSWRGEIVIFSGNTDCYQPLEASYRLTRACLEVCLEYKNPVGLITKSTLIERDVDLLAALAKEAFCEVIVSVPFLDRDAARAMEPYVPRPERRIETIARLAQAGVPVGVNIAPLIPGLNDSDAPGILAAAREAGASFYGTVMLRLPAEVKDVFEERLRALLPLRADRVLHQIEECRGGKRYDPRFGARMSGTGPRWEAIQRMIETHAAKLGYGRSPALPDPSPFRRPSAQGELF
jgi:DNA repair photolyase